MKRKSLIIVIFLFCQTLAYAHASNHRVRYVFDGDTILLDTGQRVRYVGIDAPEIGREGEESEFMALEARESNRQLVARSKIRLEFDHEHKDRHGRLLAYVFLENGEMVNGLLIRKGLAHVLCKKPNVKYQALFIRYQRLAMTEKLGIWTGKAPAPEPYYVGNSNSKRFHRPNCPSGKKTRQERRVIFNTRKDAFWEGYSPCKRCKP
jgi:micrococcal nuclease